MRRAGEALAVSAVAFGRNGFPILARGFLASVANPSSMVMVGSKATATSLATILRSASFRFGMGSLCRR